MWQRLGGSYGLEKWSGGILDREVGPTGGEAVKYYAKLRLDGRCAPFMLSSSAIA